MGPTAKEKATKISKAKRKLDLVDNTSEEEQMQSSNTAIEVTEYVTRKRGGNTAAKSAKIAKLSAKTPPRRRSGTETKAVKGRKDKSEKEGQGNNNAIPGQSNCQIDKQDQFTKQANLYITIMLLMKALMTVLIKAKQRVVVWQMVTELKWILIH